MLVDKETADAWAEQQAREIKNLKAVKNNERERAVKLVNEFRSKFKNRKIFHTKKYIREKIIKGFDDLINKNVMKKSNLLDYFKNKSIKELHEKL